MDIKIVNAYSVITVGNRDRTIRIWKMGDATQLVFQPPADKLESQCVVGSIECVVVIMQDVFVVGADSGALSIYNSNKKMPLFTVQLAHSVDKLGLPYRISALAAVLSSDIVVSGY